MSHILGSGRVFLLLGMTVAICIASTITSVAQYDTAWVRHSDGPASDADSPLWIELADSGVVVCGRSIGIGTGPDFVTIKYQATGDTSWLRRYSHPDGSVEEYAYSLTLDSAGNVYVTGQSGAASLAGAIATLKYSATGDSLWAQRYNPGGYAWNVGRGIKVDGAGAVYVAGSSWISPNDCTILKYDSAGNLVWDRLTEPGHNDALTNIVLDQDANVYVAGHRQVSTGPDLLVMKYDSAGAFQWADRYNGPGNGSDYANVLVRDESGNIFAGGASAGSGTGPDFIVAKYTSSGSRLWVSRYNGPANSDEYAYGLLPDNSGGVYAAGYSAGSGTGYDIVLLRILATGDTAWVRRYNGPGNGDDFAGFSYSPILARDQRGLLFVCGESLGDTSASDFVIVAYRPDGSFAGEMRYNGPADSSDGAIGLQVDEDGAIYVTGRTTTSQGSLDLTTVKFVMMCGCSCHADMNCDGQTDIVDVVGTINVAFRGVPAIYDLDCVFDRSDVDCSLATDVVDVVKMVNVAFRGANPSTEFCDPCP